MLYLPSASRLEGRQASMISLTLWHRHSVVMKRRRIPSSKVVGQGHRKRPIPCQVRSDRQRTGYLIRSWKAQVSEWAISAIRDRANCVRTNMLLECASLARNAWTQKMQNYFGSVLLDFMADNAIVNICTKCCSAHASKKHFSALAAHAATLYKGWYSVSSIGVRWKEDSWHLRFNEFLKWAGPFCSIKVIEVNREH